MLTKFVGRDNWGDFLRTVEAANERDGTLSPGGAAALLRVTRQRVYGLVDDHPDVRAWAFYGDASDRQAEVYEVSVRDVLRWAVRQGRIRTPEDLGLQWRRVVQLLEEVQAELLHTETKAARVAA